MERKFDESNLFARSEVSHSEVNDSSRSGRGRGWGFRAHHRHRRGQRQDRFSHDRQQPYPAPGETRLAQAATGDTVTVTHIYGDETFRGKMLARGIAPGVSIAVVKGGARQPLLVALPRSRFVLDSRSSELIAVRSRKSHGGERKVQT